MNAGVLNDPHRQFEETVLELIEHSPVGAVPNTPAYQDALRGLRTLHQIYADADHKDGYVTTRALAKLPHFQANNLEALVAGQIDNSALESNAIVFDRYVHSLPASRRAQAENYRTHVAGRPAQHRGKHIGDHDPLHSLFLVPGAGPHPGLPGNYLYGFILELSATATGEHWSVDIHDREDGAALFDAPTRQSAFDKLREVLESAPFQMDELEALGFRMA